MSKAGKPQSEDLGRLRNQTDEEIDTGDVPEVADWSDARRGRFYRPIKKQITLRIDADVLAWFKSQGARYQTRINEALREHIKQNRG